MLSLAAVAEMYGVDPATVRAWVRQGLPAFRVGRVVRIAEDDLERFRRLHTWGAGAGARVPSVDEPSPARDGNTSTGAPSYRSELTRVAAGTARNTRQGQNDRQGRGSARRSLAPIVAFPSETPA